MRRDENLSATRSAILKFLSELLHEARIELILRLLDAKQGMRLRIMEKDEVCEHLYRAIRYEPGNERILERPILKSEDNSAIFSLPSLDCADTRNATPHGREDLIEDTAMILVQELGN